MGITLRNFKTLLICSVGTAGLVACAPSSQTIAHHQADTYLSGYSHSSYGYEQTETTTIVKSRYGDAGLRPACEVQIETCGFMTVVPVYPVYQIVTAPPVVEEPPVVVIPEPLPEPEPPVIVLPPEPEPPIYVPPTPEYWPTPETPIEPWTPPRK